MRALAAFIMRGRGQAVMVASVSSALSLVLAPLAYLGAASLALVGLRNGPGEGLRTAGLAALVLGLASALALRNGPLPVLGAFLSLWVPVLLLAQMLRLGFSQGQVLAAASGLAAAGVLVLHLLLPNLAEYWLDILRRVVGPLLEQEAIELESGALERVAGLMTGLVAAIGLLGVMLSLYLARWWQAVLYNPGGFGSEFRALRLPRVFALAGVLVLAGGLIGGGAAGGLFTDLMSVALVAFLLQGLAVAHALVAGRGMSAGWLVGLYALILVWPHAAVALGLMGLIDAWVDFRRYLRAA